MILSASLEAQAWFACTSVSVMALTSASWVSGAGGGAGLQPAINTAITVAQQIVARVFMRVFLLRGILENIGTMALPAGKKGSIRESTQAGDILPHQDEVWQHVFDFRWSADQSSIALCPARFLFREIRKPIG